MVARHAGYKFPYRYPAPKGITERVLFGVGGIFKAVGGLMDELGFMLQGPAGAKESLNPNLAWAPTKADPASPPTKGQLVSVPPVSRMPNLLSIVMPQKGEGVFVAPSANVMGDVRIGARSSIWYGAVLRGDVNSIDIGKNTNIQDNVIIHVGKHSIDGSKNSVVIGNNVTIGHCATIHACTIGDNSLVGMGATVLDGCVTLVKTGEVWAGSPAKMLRMLSPEEQMFVSQSALNYAELADEHRFENGKTFEELYVESHIELERYLASDPINSVHQMWEFDKQTMLATRTKK
eukprot:gene21398-28356_t